MAILKTPAKPKGLAKPAATKGLAKPAKATKGAAKPAAPKTKLKDGDQVVFLGYAKENDSPLFEKGELLTVVAVGVDADKNVVLSCVKSEDYEAYKEDENSVTGEELLASEVDKAPKQEVDPYHELAAALQADDTLNEFIAEQGDGDPLAAGTAAQEAVAQNMFLLGGCLAKLYSDQKFREYGDYADDKKDDKVVPNSGWDKFTQEHFDMNGRKGLSFIAIYRAFNRLSGKVNLAEISSDRKIGWVKLGAMANSVTESNVEELIEQARTLSVDDFKQVLRTEYVDGNSSGTSSGSTNKVRKTTIKMVVFEDQAVAIEAVIAEAKKVLNTEDLGTIFEYILMDWAHNTLEDKDAKKVTSARNKKFAELKKSGIDISERKKAFDTLTAQIEGGGEGEGEEAAAAA